MVVLVVVLVTIKELLLEMVTHQVYLLVKEIMVVKVIVQELVHLLEEVEVLVL